MYLTGKIGDARLVIALKLFLVPFPYQIQHRINISTSIINLSEAMYFGKRMGNAFNEGFFRMNRTLNNNNNKTSQEKLLLPSYLQD